MTLFYKFFMDDFQLASFLATAFSMLGQPPVQGGLGTGDGIG